MPDKPTTTEQYLARLTPEQRSTLEQMADAIRRAAPAAQDAFSYGIPAFRLHGKVLVWYASWKQHYSLYPLSAGMVAAFAEEIADYETAKGTIRFPADTALPFPLIERLVRARVAEMEAGKK